MSMKYVLSIFAIVLGAGIFAMVGYGQESPESVSPHAPGDFEGPANHQVARDAVKRGEAAPLEEIMKKARPWLDGELVGIKFEQHHGRWFYEFRVINDAGHMLYQHFDAKNGDYVDLGGHPCESC